MNSFMLYGFGKFDLDLVEGEYCGEEKDFDTCMKMWKSSSNSNPNNVDDEIIINYIRQFGMSWC
jgi:hypothetical protein